MKSDRTSIQYGNRHVGQENPAAETSQLSQRSRCGSLVPIAKIRRTLLDDFLCQPPIFLRVADTTSGDTPKFCVDAMSHRFTRGIWAACLVQAVLDAGLKTEESRCSGDLTPL